MVPALVREPVKAAELWCQKWLHTSSSTGMRERLLGDPGFPVKLSIELGIGITMKILAELNKRGDNFSAELDFVFANVVMAIIADTMLVWLPAPRAILSNQASAKQQGALQKWLKSCPDNAFQVDVCSPTATRDGLSQPLLPFGAAAHACAEHC